MPRVWLSLGSNLDRETNIRGAVQALREAFGALVISSVYETAAVGFDGEPFYNLVVGIETEQTPDSLRQQLRAIENAHGRVRGGAKFGARTLDIDILTYGDLVSEDGQDIPRDEILRYAFVLGPLAEVAGSERHPQLGRSYAELWQAFGAAEKTGMQLVSLDLS